MTPIAITRCNICGGNRFEAGPLRRRALDGGGALPRCSACRSVERHRALRDVLLRLPRAWTTHASALQLSPDRSLEPGWFRRYELSVYRGAGSLDIQAIDRPDATYDFVLCSHVLEHVPRDTDAIRELGRITRPEGLLVVMVPDPARVTLTDDWGYADRSRHGHYRIYGRDFARRLRAIGRGVLELPIRDPVTAVRDIAYVVTDNADLRAAIEAQ